MILTGENRSPGRKISSCLLVHHKYHMDCPGIRPEPHLLHNKDQTIGADVRIVQNMLCVHIYHSRRSHWAVYYERYSGK
jgi:hypothetical protein